MGPDGADEIDPVFAQVGFAADERDLFDAELRHLADEIERLAFVGLVQTIEKEIFALKRAANWPVQCVFNRLR